MDELLASFEFEEAARADLEQLHYMSVRLEQAKKKLCERIEQTIDEEEEAATVNIHSNVVMLD
jgi:hypothetical protein